MRINKLCSRIFSCELHGFRALYNTCLRRRRTNILNVGESTQVVGEQGVGETTRRRNDRNSQASVNLWRHNRPNLSHETL